MRTLNENLQKLQISDAEECMVLKESKTFFRFLFYNAFIDICKRVKTEEMVKLHGRKHYFETLKWNIDGSFLKETFEKAMSRMQENMSLGFFLDAFYYFIKNEHPKELENPEGFARLKNLLGRYLQKLFYQNSYERMLRITMEQEQIKARAFPLADKKVYFMVMAKDIDCNISYNEHLRPVNWKERFDYLKQTISYIEVDNGYTVKKLACEGFSCIQGYFYMFYIVETKENFNSSESNPRKAFLLHKRL